MNLSLSRPSGAHLDVAASLSEAVALYHHPPPSTTQASTATPQLPQPEDLLSALPASADNATVFYGWLEKVEAQARVDSEAGVRFVRLSSPHLSCSAYIASLKESRTACETILHAANEMDTLLDSIEASKQQVDTATTTLSDACETLIKEKDALEKESQIMKKKLALFNELESLTQRFASEHLTAASEDFLDLMTRVGESVFYLESNATELTETYLPRFRLLQSRSLALLKVHVVTVIRQATSQVQDVMRSEASASALPGITTSALSVKFRAAAPRVRPLIEFIEGKHDNETKRTLGSLHESFVAQRTALLAPVIHSQLATLATGPLHDMVREGAAALARLCQSETALFGFFFTTATDALSDALTSLCQALYEQMRPLYLRLHTLEPLGAIVSVISGELMVPGGTVDSRGPVALTALRPVLEQIVMDVQERLTFCADSFIRTSIRGFRPTAADLAYPSLLEDQDILYPTLTRTLHILSILYDSVGIDVFKGLAQEAVQECTDTLVTASSAVQAAQRVDPIGLHDGNLFMIRHLVVLLEQLTPFNVDLEYTETGLDFGNLRQALSRLLFNRQASLFAMSRQNPVLDVVISTPPRVRERVLDSRQALDTRLRSACETVVVAVTSEAIGGLMTWIARAKIIAEEKGSIDGEEFADGNAVAVLLQESDRRLEQLAPVLKRMAMYLGPTTVEVLLKPIMGNICNAYGELRLLLGAGAEVPAVEDIEGRIGAILI